MNAFEIARDRYPLHKIPFLTKMVNRARIEKPYTGLKILHNTPLTIESVLKIEPLIAGGAKVTATNFKGLPPRDEALEILSAAHVPVLLEHEFNGEYDFHLDCCAQLLAAPPPKMGTVELTQTGSEIYKRIKTRYPVMSVDDSRIKVLETLYATGDGFVRAMRQLRGGEIYDKHYILVGFGKVGQGIARALNKISAHITVIDENISEFSSKSQENIRFIDARKKDEIKEIVRHAYCVVTATGVQGVISDYYDLNKKNFSQTTLLANMGGDDEWGDNFSKSDVLFEKMTLNFSLPEPTDIMYLDPVFYAHNLGVDLILSGQLNSGYNCMPEEVSTEILQEWQAFHGLTDKEILFSKEI